MPRCLSFHIFDDARLLPLLSRGDLCANRSLGDLCGSLLDIGLGDAVEKIGISLETKLAALKRHIVVQVIAENIRLDDEIPTLRQILIRPRLVELLSKLRDVGLKGVVRNPSAMGDQADFALRSEEHTSELKTLMRISYAAPCLTKKNKKLHTIKSIT